MYRITLFIYCAELILQAFRPFTYVAAHSPTLPSLYLRHSSFSNPSVASDTSELIFQPFFRFSYVTGFSLTSPGEQPMVIMRRLNARRSIDPHENNNDCEVGRIRLPNHGSCMPSSSSRKHIILDIFCHQSFRDVLIFSLTGLEFDGPNSHKLVHQTFFVHGFRFMESSIKFRPKLTV